MSIKVGQTKFFKQKNWNKNLKLWELSFFLSLVLKGPQSKKFCCFSFLKNKVFSRKYFYSVVLPCFFLCVCVSLMGSGGRRCCQFSVILFPVWSSRHAASTNTHFLSPQDPLPVHLLLVGCQSQVRRHHRDRGRPGWRSGGPEHGVLVPANRKLLLYWQSRSIQVETHRLVQSHWVDMLWCKAGGPRVKLIEQ